MSEIVKRWKAEMPDFFKKVLKIVASIFTIGAGLLLAHKEGVINLESYRLFNVTLFAVVTHIEAASALVVLIVKLTAKAQVPNEALQ